MLTTDELGFGYAGRSSFVIGTSAPSLLVTKPLSNVTAWVGPTVVTESSETDSLKNTSFLSPGSAKPCERKRLANESIVLETDKSRMDSEIKGDDRSVLIPSSKRYANYAELQTSFT